jgi:hypothetical protein
VTPRVRAEWGRRVAAEYRSAALTAQALHWAIQAGLSEGLLHTALRVVRDELDHAALSHECLRALGGQDEPVPLDARAMAAPGTAGVLGGLVDTVVVNFCLGETFAVPLFDAMRRGSTHPAVSLVLVRVLRDEAIHRQFGWDVLDELLARVPGVSARVEALLPSALAGFAEAYAPPDDGEPLTPEERACGLLSHAEYRAIFERTRDGDVLPRLADRGLEVPVTSR